MRKGWLKYVSKQSKQRDKRNRQKKRKNNNSGVNTKKKQCVCVRGHQKVSIKTKHLTPETCGECQTENHVADIWLHDAYTQRGARLGKTFIS